MKKLLCIMIICVAIIASNKIIKAQNILQGYTINIDEINDSYIKKEIQSISINKCNHSWCLSVNNQKISTFNDNHHTANYITNDNQLIKIMVNIDTLTIDFDYIANTYQSFTAGLTLINIDNIQYLDFYPNRNEPYYVRLVGVKNNTNWEFSDQRYDYVYYDEMGKLINCPVNYSFYLNTTQRVLVVNHNTSTSSFVVVPELMTQSIFLETFVPAHPLAIEYLEKDLPMQSFYEAKNALYASALIDQVVANEKLVLKHKESDLTYEVPLRQFITYWRRISDGNYDTSTTETIQTVCQWHEEACTEARNHYKDNGRLYAIFGASYSYNDIDSYNVTELVHDYTTLYKNISWPQSMWVEESDNINDELVAGQMRIKEATWGNYSSLTLDNHSVDCEDDFDCSYTKVIKYRKKSATWGMWSDYSSQYPSDCQDNNDCTWESIQLYNKKTGYWNPYSSYVSGYPSDCADSFDCRWKSKRYYRQRSYHYVGTYSSWRSYCTVTDDHHCSTYYKYTCKAGALSNTRYSTTSYSLFTQGLCGSGYRITAKISGYRYRYIKWGAWSSYSTNSCSNIVGYSKCESELRYATSYRLWGSWSGYNQTSCSNSDVVKCQGPITYYRQKTRDWNTWSDYIYDSCITNNEQLCQSQTQYAYRYKIWSEWSEWLDYDASIKPSDNRKIYYRTNPGVITWDEFPGISNKVGQDMMFLNETKRIDNGTRLVSYELAKLSQNYLSTIPAMSESAILELSEEIAIKASQQRLLQKLLLENERVLLLDLQNSNLDEYRHFGNLAKENFLNSSLFIPYIYVIDHYRATKKDIEILGYNENLQITNTKTSSLNMSESISLIEDWISIAKDNKVIFYDHNNPLHTYEELPDNWKEYQFILDELINVGIEDNEITILLNKEDINNIRNYLTSGGYQKMGTCDILVEFSYLIKDKSNEFNDWLNSYQGACIYVDSD